MIMSNTDKFDVDQLRQADQAMCADSAVRRIALSQLNSAPGELLGVNPPRLGFARPHFLSATYQTRTQLPKHMPQIRMQDAIGPGRTKNRARE